MFVLKIGFSFPELRMGLSVLPFSQIAEVDTVLFPNPFFHVNVSVLILGIIREYTIYSYRVLQ